MLGDGGVAGVVRVNAVAVEQLGVVDEGVVVVQHGRLRVGGDPVGQRQDLRVDNLARDSVAVFQDDRLEQEQARMRGQRLEHVQHVFIVGNEVVLVHPVLRLGVVAAVPEDRDVRAVRQRLAKLGIIPVRVVALLQDRRAADAEVSHLEPGAQRAPQVVGEMVAVR